METIVAKCINNKICSSVCNVKTCKSIPFLCGDDQCSCHQQHQQCTTTLKWKSMRQKFTNKLKKSSSQMDGYFTQINDIYRNVLKQIDKSFAQIKNIFENFGLSQLEREVYLKLKQKKFIELTGEMINKMEVDLMGNKKQFQNKNIEKEKKQIEMQTIILIQMLEGLTNLIKLDSKIIQDVGILSSFFTKKIISMNLLYRASENNFQVSKFHEKCDGKQNTITILKTEFGNVIGGYTPYPWDKNKHGKWEADNRMQSFIFSLTNKHKLTLKEGKKDKAILNDNGYGPIFGGGHDILICDKANQNTNNWARSGNTYNYNNEYVYGNQQSYKKWSGQSNGNKFKIQQWQVYSIEF